MIGLQELVTYTDTLLDSASFSDYCPNGLQVEGRARVETLVGGVTASLALVEAACAEGADAVLVHHGYFWKGEDERIQGMKRKRLQRLLAEGISLLAYHLPLDAHPVFGNNVQLARVLALPVDGRFSLGGGPELALYGRLETPMSAQTMVQHIAGCLGRTPLHIAGGPDSLRAVGWCTGAAQSFIEPAVRLGLDAFISGEVSEQTVHVARECGIHYYGAGHHATERFGVQALGRHLGEHFSLRFRFIDIDNPV
jgi:dinuclear metal center YbgI/SA1388 family protein